MKHLNTFLEKKNSVKLQGSVKSFLFLFSYKKLNLRKTKK